MKRRDETEQPAVKRAKTNHPAIGVEGAEVHFADGLLEQANVERLHHEYTQSAPYKHVVVDKLFKNALVTKVKDECIGELSFTEKETDIYKVHQTGDLASLNYLEEAEVARLRNLVTFRNALYSETFREFVRKVTGCGPLSGNQQDMSVNSYKKGCHLLNHDDVIGSRRVSYIFYMPLPQSEEWKREWGGSLELYPVKQGSDGINEPENVPSKVIPPSWNQFIFFEVQPGHSFHSVEEVVVDEGDDQRQRLSISGWFHKAQEGEPGYEPEPETAPKSSLEQLSAASKTIFTPYPESSFPPHPLEPLDPTHAAELAPYINPAYLDMTTLSKVIPHFVEESTLVLADFLCQPIASRLSMAIKLRDADDGLDNSKRKEAIPPHSTEAMKKNGWMLRGPPHKARYCALERQAPTSDTAPVIPNDNHSVEDILQHLQDHLFPSDAFRTWLATVCHVVPMGHRVEVRRFRPGLDYSLATGDAEDESRLDVVLGLTPEVSEHALDKSIKERALAEAADDEMVVVDEDEGWEKGGWGGWECYMAPHEGEDDPAVYRSGPSRTKKDDAEATANGKDADSASASTNGKQNDASSSKNGATDPDDHDDGNESDEDDIDEENEDDGGTLLTVQPGFNRLVLVLRDSGVLRFVKYVSASAPSSRWDISAEYEVGMIESDDEEDAEGGSGETAS